MKKATVRTLEDHPLVINVVAVMKDLIEIVQTVTAIVIGTGTGSGSGTGIVTENGNGIGGTSMTDVAIVMVETGTLFGPGIQRGMVGGTLIGINVLALVGVEAGAEVGAGAEVRKSMLQTLTIALVH